MTRNNKNRNNQTAVVVPTEEVTAEEFHYEELTPNQVATLHQEKWTQYLDECLNQWGIMTNNGSKSLNVFRIVRQLPICAIIENTWRKCVKWLYKCR
jgi:hypothetical protein